MLRDLIQRIGSHAVLLCCLLLASGCSIAAVPSGRATPLEGRAITAEEIERSGAQNAWEVLRWANVPLGFYESRNGQPMQLSQRGARSFSPGSRPLVIVDGMLTEGLRLLHDIPARDIASIRVLSGIDAMYRYGTGAAGRVIVIETRKGSHR